MRNLLMILVGATVMSLPAQAAFKAAYIDMQSAIQATSAGKNAKSRLEKEFNKKKDELQKREGKIKKEAEEFEKKQMVLSEKVRNQRRAELQKKMFEFQQELQKSQMNIQKKELEMTKPILTKLRKIIGDVAKEKGYSMVFEKAEHSVMWADTSYDITDTVVKRFEKAK